jgi:preprotein translocase subunit SecB
LTMDNTENATSIVAAAKVAVRVDLQSVTLLAATYKRQQECPAGPYVFDIKRTSRYEIGEDKKTISVVLIFSLHASGEGDAQKEENAFLDIEATFFLLYSIERLDGLDDSTFGSFADLNGTYNAWPYWREFVQNVTSRMGLPPLTIPVFRLPRGPAKKANEKREDKVETVVEKK